MHHTSTPRFVHNEKKSDLFSTSKGVLVFFCRDFDSNPQVSGTFPASWSSLTGLTNM
jgi:hypothetical protein